MATVSSFRHENPGENANQGAEKIMETLPIEAVRRLLNDNNANVKTKQTELQLMVGSRYHEMIESADSIVQMKDEAQQVIQLLSHFPESHHSLLAGAPSPMSEAELDKSEMMHVGGKVSADLATQLPVQVMLAAPSAIWVALDTQKYLEASQIFLKCAAAAKEGLASASLGTTSAETYLLRGQWAYVEQLSGRIVNGAKVVLMQRGLSRDSYCHALIAIQQVQATNATDILFLLLQHRSKWVLQALRKANHYAKNESLDLKRSRKWLSEAVKNMKQTVEEVYEFFSDGGILSKGLAESELASKLTSWVMQAITSIVKIARKILTAIKQARDLTAFQEALTAACQSPESVLKGADGEEVDNCSPPLDYSKHLDTPKLFAGLKQDQQLASWMGRFSTDALCGMFKDMQLWGLMFSHIFAESAEILLKDSLVKVRENFRARVQSVLASAKTYQNIDKTERPLPHTVFTSVASTVRAFEGQFRSTLRDATASVHADKDSSEHFAHAVYARSVDMLACLVHHLRQDLEEAISERNVVGVLVVMKLVWMLSCRARPLEGLLQPPKTSKVSPDSISVEQLQAAFEIADTDGNGIMTADEALEGLDAVVMGGDSKVTVDKSLYVSFTFEEFALFSTSILDVQAPFVHFNACLVSLAETASKQWAELVIAGPRERLEKELLGAAQEWESFDDESWRKTFGLWEQMPLQVESEAGEDLQEKIWFPTSLSLALSSFLHDVSDEILNMISVADITQDVMIKFHESSIQQAIVNPLSWAHLSVKKLVFEIITSCFVKLLCETHLKIVEVEQLCESCHLQLLLDLTFMQKLIKDGKASLSPSVSANFAKAMDLLTNVFDPINLQIYTPNIESNAATCFEGSRLFLQIIFNPSDKIFDYLTEYTEISKDQGIVSDFLTSSNILPLAQGTQRFNLLPVPIQPTATDNTLARSFLSQKSSSRDDMHGSPSYNTADLTDSLGSRARTLMGQIGQHSIFASASSFLTSGKK